MKRGLSRRDALALLGGAAALGAATPSRAAVAPVLRRGMNIHHVLNWPEVRTTNGRLDYVWPPFKSAGYDLGANELARLKGFGFDFIRLTADPSILMESQSDESRWAFLRDHILNGVRGLIGAGFNVVFDLHPVEVNPADGPEHLVQSESGPLFLSYVRLVGRVAAMLDSLPPGRVVFELMNEPYLTSEAEIRRWQAMLETLHASARASAPDLPLLLTGANWGDRHALMKLDLTPFKSSNVLYTFHYYDPHLYTHQGVDSDDTRFVSGLTWPATPESAAIVMTRAAALVAGRHDLSPAGRNRELAILRRRLDSVIADRYDPRRVRADFGEVAQWAQSNGIPANRILLGEFGCVISSLGLPLGPDRLDWFAAVRSAAEENGFGWAYWAYKGYGGMEFVDLSGRLHENLLAPLGLNA